MQKCLAWKLCRATGLAFHLMYKILYRHIKKNATRQKRLWRIINDKLGLEIIWVNYRGFDRWWILVLKANNFLQVLQTYFLMINWCRNSLSIAWEMVAKKKILKSSINFRCLWKCSRSCVFLLLNSQPFVINSLTRYKLQRYRYKRQWFM